MRRMGKRGAYTSWIQTTATLGLFLSLMVILGTRTDRRSRLCRLGLARSVHRLDPAAGRVGLDPPEHERVARLPEDEGRRQDLQGAAVRILRPVEEPEDRDPGTVGLTAGQAVVWYSGQFYALFFLTQALKVDGADRQHHGGDLADHRHAVLHRVRRLSDKIGRKPIIMAGCLLAVVTYFPVFKALTKAANPDLAAAQAKNKVVGHGRCQAECSFQFNPTGTVKFTSSCDIAKQVLAAPR
jgi:hypothetical protein